MASASEAAAAEPPAGGLGPTTTSARPRLEAETAVARAARCDGDGGPTAAAAFPGQGLAALTDEQQQRLLSFAALLPTLAAFASCCRRFRDAGRSPVAWEGVVVEVGRAVFESEQGQEALVALGARHWGLAKEVRLPPHRWRHAVAERLRQAWPQLHVSVAGDGPFLLFAMASENFRVGACTALHFFEPRYRWMCRRLSEPSADAPPVFGWVTSGRPTVGATGSLCEVLELSRNSNGTYNATIRATAAFKLLEVWPEMAPGLQAGAPLSVGYVQRLEPRDSARRELGGQMPPHSLFPGEFGWEEGDSESEEEFSEDSEILGSDGTDMSWAIEATIARLIHSGRGPGGLDVDLPESDESSGGEDPVDGAGSDSESS